MYIPIKHVHGSWLRPVVVEAEEAGDDDAEDEEDDARSGDDDHGPGADLMNPFWPKITDET
jgi:hypothetical protein